MQTNFLIFKDKGTKMKKLLSIALVAAAFVLVGCEAEKTKTTLPDNTSPKQMEKCKGKKCHRHVGKLGEEKTTDDSAK
jgi:uncharacterized lipoprotein YajG